jgi:hypothetical protein
VLAVERAASENLATASGDWVAASKKGDANPASVSASSVVL